MFVLSRNVQKNYTVQEMYQLFFYGLVLLDRLFFCSFEKTWHIYNNGTEEWPVGCQLQCAGGDDFGGERVSVPCLLPGEGMHLNIKLRSPAQPGMYQSKWRLCTPTGSYFGGK